ncbi:MAG TPA: hypothetical protein VD886_05370, partial [Herpetosiphonaceae bacterium]|nr:hypothetical protein [Herpetosiphonaceae bacterium]
MKYRVLVFMIAVSLLAACQGAAPASQDLPAADNAGAAVRPAANGSANPAAGAAAADAGSTGSAPAAGLAGAAEQSSGASAAGLDLTRLPLGDERLSAGPQVGWIWPCHVEANA